MGTTMLIKGKLIRHVQSPFNLFSGLLPEQKQVFINVRSVFFIFRIKILQLFVLKVLEVRLLIANSISSD